jgi:hypothetical protein
MIKKYDFRNLSDFPRSQIKSGRLVFDCHQDDWKYLSLLLAWGSVSDKINMGQLNPQFRAGMDQTEIGNKKVAQILLKQTAGALSNGMGLWSAPRTAPQDFLWGM